jgi:hypothetical protein
MSRVRISLSFYNYMLNNFLFLLFSFFFLLTIFFFRSKFFNFYQPKILGLKLFLILDSRTFRLVVHILLFLFVSFLQGGVPNPSLCADFTVESIVEPMGLDQIEAPRATNNNIPPNRVVIDESDRSADFSDITVRNDSRTPRNSLITTADQQNVFALTTESQLRRSERIAFQTRAMVHQAYAVVDADIRVLDPRIDSRMGMLSSSNVALIPVPAINREINVVDGVADELRVTNMGRLREEFMEDSTGNKKNPLSCLKSLFPRPK